MLKIFDKLIETEELPRSVSESVKRSKSVRSVSPMHRWWAVQTPILARIATFLALTERQNPDDRLLAELGQLPLSSETQNVLRREIRDAQWRWLWRERENADLRDRNRDVPVSPENPRILDPFAGSGSIPAEATRLGCHAHALDLNPLSFQILRASLVFPIALGSVDHKSPGTSEDNQWDGLGNEVTHWAVRVREIAEQRLAPAYPLIDDSGKKSRPWGYFWVHTTGCKGCGNVYPASRHVPIQRTTGGLRFLSVDGDAHSYQVQIQSSEDVNAATRRRSLCPRCGDMEVSGTYGTPILVAVAVGLGKTPQFIPVDSRTASTIAHWNAGLASRLEELLVGTVALQLESELTEAVYGIGRPVGAIAFKDLFSARQLLAGLEYFKAIGDAEVEMRTAGMAGEHIAAICTYLAFLLGYVVERNNLGCTWRHSPIAKVSAAFDRMAFSFPHSFVEQVPHNLLSTWCDGIQQKIQQARELPRAAEVKLGSATDLPYDDEYFDAIITDPPFYDRVPYAELSDFYWVWECGLFERLESESVPRAVVSSSGKPLADFQKQFEKAISESYRVLKQGRMFAMLLTGRIKEHFEAYISTAQASGFELLNVKSITHERQLSEKTKSVTAIAYFRKPFRNAKRPPLGVDAAVTLKAIGENKPILYSALASLFIQELDERDLAEFIPGNAKGTKTEILMEVLADSDPRRLLRDCFGSHGIRRIATKIGLPVENDSAERLFDKVLIHFGFTIPVSKVDVNPNVATDQLNRICHQVAQAREKSELRGAFLEASTTVERMIKLAVFGWARVIFERNWRSSLEGLLPGGRSLEKLTFGDIAGLFKALPDAGAEVVQRRGLDGKIGRAHVYRPKRFKERLDLIVALRNKIEHDKDGYWSDGNLRALAADLGPAVADSARLISDLIGERAIPRIARATEETRDEWNRTTYTLLLDDGGEREVSLSRPLKLGMHYLYFGSATNPRPVDPIMIPADEE